MLYYRHRLYERWRRERQQQTNIELTEDELHRAELEDANLHVANNVLENCLSTLKHETMYYPSRIRQLLDSGDNKSLAEVSAYYRDLYSILIQQAAEQMEHIRLHVRPVELYGQTVVGDENLLRYLFELVLDERGERKEERGERNEKRRERKEERGERIDNKENKRIQVEVKDDHYVVYQVPLTGQISPMNSLIARQIVRDHGEAVNRHGCGITIDNQQVNITLPRYNGKI